MPWRDRSELRNCGAAAQAVHLPSVAARHSAPLKLHQLSPQELPLIARKPFPQQQRAL